MRVLIRRRRISSLALAFGIGALAARSPRAEDAFLPLQAATPGSFNYARLSDIQVFLDASPSRCSVFLTDGQEIKAFQKCASITEHLEQIGLVSFPNAFGRVLLAPSFVTSMVSIGKETCRLNLRNGRWAPVDLPCSKVHDAFP